MESNLNVSLHAKGLVSKVAGLEVNRYNLKERESELKEKQVVD